MMQTRIESLKKFLVSCSTGVLVSVLLPAGMHPGGAEARPARYQYCVGGQYYESWSQSDGTSTFRNQIHYTIASDGTCNWKIYWQEYGQSGSEDVTGTQVLNGAGTVFDNNGHFCIQPPTSGWSSPFYFGQVNDNRALIDDRTFVGACAGGTFLDYYPYNQP